MASKGYKWKLIAFVQLLVLAALITLGFVTYENLTDLVEKEMGMRARGVAIAGACLVQDRLDEYLQLKSKSDETKPFYVKMKRIFQQFKASNNLRYMYTERQIDQNKIVYILDAEPADSKYASHIGDEDQMNVLRRRTYASQQPEYGPLTVDPVWGVFITGYAPIINPADNQFIGLLGVDIGGAEVQKLFSQIKAVIVVTIAIVFVIGFLITYKLASQMVRPIFIDGLLEVFNHKYFQESLAKEISKAEKNGGELSLLIIDLDNFKNINDTYGHSFGDIILRATAKLLKDSLRSGDILARYGGEEFAVILPGTSVECAYRLACRLRERMEKSSVRNEDTAKNVTATISIGLAEWQPGMTRNDLINRADKAMYRSKAKDRNTVSVDDCGWSNSPA